MRLSLSLPQTLILFILLSTGPVLGQEISDIYSSLQSFDVTVEGDCRSCILQVDLLHDGKVLQTSSVPLEGPGVYVGQWKAFKTEEDSYEACARLVRSGEILSNSCYSFYYGGRVPVRFDVRDFVADSKGIGLTLTSRDPTIVDIDYMLVSGNKALYVAKESSYSIGGGGMSPVLLSWDWKQLLQNGEEYSGRVKIVEKTHGQTRAFMETFVAEEDAKITETYEDETGASATVLGNSRVPFEGKLVFVLYQNGTEITTIEKATPVLLVGDDETVEISWNQTLDPGIYRLKVLLMDRKGEVVDLWESVIEAEAPARPAPVEVPQEESPSVPACLAVLALLAATSLKRMRPPEV